MVNNRVYNISQPDWLFEPNHFITTFATGKGRSGRRHFYQVQSQAEQLCMPLDASGWRWSHLKKGKSHIGNFGVATNLSLFFLKCFCILCCVSQKISFFLAGNEDLGVKKINSHLILGSWVAARSMSGLEVSDDPIP
jgi:hypothetical protein